MASSKEPAITIGVTFRGLNVKKFLVVVCSIFLVTNSGLAPAAGNIVGPEQVQQTPADKSTPAGLAPAFDLDLFKVVLTAEGEIQVLVKMKSTPKASDYLAPDALVKVEFDTNLDGVADYFLDSEGKYDFPNWQKRPMKLPTGDVTKECWSWGIITPRGDLGWWFARDCFDKLSSVLAVRVSSTQDKVTFDYFPEAGAWYKAKSGYMSVAKCNSSALNTILTYDYVTHICTKTSGKWSWKDYGPIVAKSSKPSTEKAYYACRLAGQLKVELLDGGKTLSLITGNKLGLYVSDKDFDCVKKYVVMPSWASTMIGQTRSQDGIVKAAWAKVNAFWSFSPDSGLKITLTTK